MTGGHTPRALLAACTVRLDTGQGPQGTAFFVAPHYAVTAAHVVGGERDLRVSLAGEQGSWRGHVEDTRPPAAAAAAGRPYPAPDVALIRIDDGPGHLCALLGHQLTGDDARVIARGHTRTLNGINVTAETESFDLTGELETPVPGCTLLKLGHGQAPPGMSGAPVLDKGTGEVIGMLRTSRDITTDLGAWVVPAPLIRELWPQQASLGNDLFHRDHPLWRQAASQLKHRATTADPPPAAQAPGGVIYGDVGAAIYGGNVGVVNIHAGKPGPGGPGAPDG
jgi:hypothetical protein